MPFKEISIQPELSRPPCFRITRIPNEHDEKEDKFGFLIGYGNARYGMVGFGIAKYATVRSDMARSGVARYDIARYDTARYGKVRCGIARYGIARYGELPGRPWADIP